MAYDQEEYARRLHYDRPVAPSLLAFKGARESSGQLLDELTDAEWTRSGTHTESGKYSVLQWLEIYAEHAAKHAGQITRAIQSSRG